MLGVLLIRSHSIAIGIHGCVDRLLDLRSLLSPLLADLLLLHTLRVIRRLFFGKQLTHLGLNALLAGIILDLRERCEDA